MPSGFTRIELVGDKKLIRMFKAAKVGVPTHMYKDVLDHAHLVFDLSQAIVPVDTGELQATGTVLPRFRGPLATADIQYGSEDVDYAFIVHEDLNAHHEPPTQAKYLETAQDTYVKEFPPRISRSIYEVFRVAAAIA